MVATLITLMAFTKITILVWIGVWLKSNESHFASADDSDSFHVAPHDFSLLFKQYPRKTTLKEAHSLLELLHLCTRGEIFMKGEKKILCRFMACVALTASHGGELRSSALLLPVMRLTTRLPSPFIAHPAVLPSLPPWALSVNLRPSGSFYFRLCTPRLRDRHSGVDFHFTLCESSHLRT